MKYVLPEKRILSYFQISHINNLITNLCIRILATKGGKLTWKTIESSQLPREVNKHEKL